MTTSRQEMYEELIHLGFTPSDAWEKISEMDFAEDYEEDCEKCYEY